MADPVTNWVDGRIQVGVQAAMQELLAHEDQILANAANKFRDAIVGDFAVLSGKLADIPKVFTDAFTAIPGEISQLESQGLQGLEAIPQQVAAQVKTIAATLPAQIAQAIGNLFPHFLRHVADLPPKERDTLLGQYAAQAVETADDLAEHRKRVRDPEER